MNIESDKAAFLRAHRAYEEHMLSALGVEDVEEYEKIKEIALNKAAKVIEQYRETLEDRYQS